MMNKDKINQAFGKAAYNYDNNAYIQKIASDKLISLVKNLPIPKHIYEIGCGTGYLTKKLLNFYPNIPYLAIDISENMIFFCREKFSPQDSPYLQFKVEDGENIKFSSPSEWIVSNFTFQWFEKQIDSIKYLHENSKFLIFTTLLIGTFQEWKILCKKFGLSDKVIPFLKEVEFLDHMKSLNPYYLSVETEKEIHPTPSLFLKRLHNIGANSTLCNHKKTDVSIMRRILQNNDPLEISYRVAYCILENPKL